MNMTIDLFCFPFAGGNRYSYLKMKPFLPENIRLIPLEYPGRGGRVSEKFIREPDLLAEDLLQQVTGQLENPFGFFGHSMGALMAYLVAQKMRKGNLYPEYLFVSGAIAPCLRKGDSRRHMLPRTEFILEIKKLGGSPDEVLFNEELMDFFEPILRADLMTLETYHYLSSPPLDIPIYLAVGADEPISAEQASAWKTETTQQFELKIFSGSHFFIFDHAQSLMLDVSERLFNKILAV
jgi:surfactin synthase thioesterase subunit